MRKRKKLEVSTFPFLAVLLCTMGSLILLLLVMDKKAKKAALEKAYENAWNQSKALQAKADAEEKNTEADKKAWIKLKSEQHNDLLKKESALEQEITLLKNELALIERSNQRSNINISSFTFINFGRLSCKKTLLFNLLILIMNLFNRDTMARKFDFQVESYRVSSKIYPSSGMEKPY
jgi:hypothetical protein